jgi:hypothetical protein
MFVEYSEYPSQQVNGYGNHEDFASRGGRSSSRSSSASKSSASRPTTGSTTVVQTTTRTGGSGYRYGYGVPIIATTPIIASSPVIATTNGGTVVYTRRSSTYGWVFAITLIAAIIALVYYFGDYDGDETVTTTTIIRNGGKSLAKLSKSARYLRK